MANVIRFGLVGLLVVGGVVRLATASTPERPVIEAPAPSAQICRLGTSCG